MRMWMVTPRLLCRAHLLGEHKELHMLAGSLRRGRSIAGHLARGQLDPSAMGLRHQALVLEMLGRGYKHASPLDVPKEAWDISGQIDVPGNVLELVRRCPECAKRILSAKCG